MEAEKGFDTLNNYQLSLARKKASNGKMPII